MVGRTDGSSNLEAMFYTIYINSKSRHKYEFISVCGQALFYQLYKESTGSAHALFTEASWIWVAVVVSLAVICLWAPVTDEER